MQTFKIEKIDSQCVVTWRHYNGDVFAGFILLALLTLGIAWLTQLPLWGLTLFCLLLALHTWSGKTRITLNTDGLLTAYTNLIRKREKWFDLTDIRRFEKQIRHSHGKLSSGQYTYLLRVVCQNDRSSQSFGIPARQEMEDELDDLCDQLNVFLGTLKAVVAGVPAQWEVPEPLVFGLDSVVQHREPPPKCRWHYQTDFDGIGFRKQGEDNVREILRALYRAVFDNGIIWLFALAIIFGLRQEEPPVEDGIWAGVFILLTPFALYGLFSIGVLLYYLREWCRVTTWMLAQGEAEVRSVAFGSRRTEHHNLTGWNSLVVRLPADEKITPELIAVGNPDAIRDFYDACERWQLVFLDADGEQLLAIEKLSKPEALWMADVILREQRAIR